MSHDQSGDAVGEGADEFSGDSGVEDPDGVVPDGSRDS